MNPKRILFLSSDPSGADNRTTIPSAFLAAGWQVERAQHAQLEFADGVLRAADHELNSFDVIWPIGFGERDDFLDRAQLLSLCTTPLINDVHAYLLEHGKASWMHHMPETHVLKHPETLRKVLHRGEDWILKPLAGSHGRGILRLNGPPAEMLQQGIEHLEQHRGYFMLQRFEAAIAQGEKRVLVVAGEVIGVYTRTPRNGLTANLASGGEARRGKLKKAEQTLLQTVLSELHGRGIRFAAVDLAYPFLVEVNLANPGGLKTLNELYRADHGIKIVQAVENWLAE